MLNYHGFVPFKKLMMLYCYLLQDPAFEVEIVVRPANYFLSIRDIYILFLRRYKTVVRSFGKERGVMFLVAYFLIEYLHSASMLLYISLSTQLYLLGLIKVPLKFLVLDLDHIEYTHNCRQSRCSYLNYRAL